ncbi:hypothetical protein TWF718_003753 [Orbilia javanica]|uniref:Uncharacterized protein n=1 Tax=Orbilia javanica TaxID=47235 RepID=A0AAN8N5A9_9PEZI
MTDLAGTPGSRWLVGQSGLDQVQPAAAAAKTAYGLQVAAVGTMGKTARYMWGLEGCRVEQALIPHCSIDTANVHFNILLIS